MSRTIIITGASQGIGRGIALTFARHGARVALVARSADRRADLDRPRQTNPFDPGVVDAEPFGVLDHHDGGGATRHDRAGGDRQAKIDQQKVSENKP